MLVLRQEYKDGIVSTFEDERILVTCIGLITDDNKSESILNIGHQAIEGRLDYNTLHGFYRVVVQEKEKDEYLFFGDNCGSLVFFIDRTRGVVSDSFLGLKKQRKGVYEPNLAAVYQLLAGGYIIGNETLIKGVFSTDPEYVYHMQGDCIWKETKHLVDLPDSTGKSLGQIMDDLRVNMHRDACAVCTGGTDSRTILAHLGRQNWIPEHLVLTAHPDNPDVEPATAVAKAAGRELEVIIPQKITEQGLREGFNFLDGLYDPVNAYRQYQKCQTAVHWGCLYEFGGTGGEFYKNAFCRLFMWRLFTKRKRDEKLFKCLLGSLLQEKTWVGEPVLDAKEEVYDILQSIISGIKNKDLLVSCNTIGIKILSKKLYRIANGYAKSVIKVDPLLDRDVISQASQHVPIKNAMAIWQRKEIATCMPALSDLPTANGYTCSIKPLKLFGERVQTGWFYASRVFARVRKRLGLSYKDVTQKYWDEDYGQAVNTDLYKQAVKTCKSLRLIKDGVDPDDIPLSDCGNVLLLGMLFDDLVQ